MSTLTEGAELKPCPFCGGAAGEVSFDFITCLNADLGERCAGKDIRVDSDHPEQWNTRVGVAPEPFQARVDPWLMECFGLEIARDILERNHRFLEEALELVQANGCTAHEAHQLVDYVYGRDQGEINQEVGGVMVTLAALCLASGVDMHEAAETELARVWTKVEKIRSKHFAKPKFSPLPGASEPQRSAATSAEPVACGPLVCEASKQDGVVCGDECDRESGVRPTPQCKTIYVKPLRTLVAVDERFADQIRDLLNATPAAPVAGSEMLAGMTPELLAETIHKARFKDREPPPFGLDRSDTEYAQRIAAAIIRASAAVGGWQITDEMLDRALIAYEAALLDLHANAYASAEPISVSEIRASALKAAFTAALSRHQRGAASE